MSAFILSRQEWESTLEGLGINKTDIGFLVDSVNFLLPDDQRIFLDYLKASPQSERVAMIDLIRRKIEALRLRDKSKWLEILRDEQKLIAEA
ncbi:MAG: hypothetical protein WCJ29_05780 [bacterium]